MKKITIKDQGQKLPIGVLKDNRLNKEFTLRPYKGKIDRFLNIYREANEGKSMAHLAAKFLSLITESAGGLSFPLMDNGDSTPEQELKIHDLYFADALYIYVYARIASVGEWINIPVVCGNQKCGYRGELKANLLTSEVSVIENKDEIYTWIDLKDGIKINGKACRRIKLQPVKYRALLLPGSSHADINGISYSQLRESIAEIEGAPQGYIILDSDIDEISKIDLLRIDRKAGDSAAGLDMRTKAPCPNCGNIFEGPLQWSFDPFFGSSIPVEELMTYEKKSIS